MTELKFKTNAKIYMESGEEDLLQNIEPTQDPSRVEKILVGVDNGSTQVRCSLVRRTDEVEAFDNIYVIPSTFTEVGATETLVPNSTEIYHRMDSIIKCNIPDGKFQKVRVVRGSKCLNANGVISRINSSNQKVDTPAFYINLIDALAYSILMDNAKRQVPTAAVYETIICCSLPPDDASSDFNMNTYLKSIKGEFEWVSAEYGISFKIIVKDTMVTTEPEAAVKAHYLLKGEEIPHTVLCLENGGRNSSTAVLFNGSIFEPANKAFDYGGTQLVDKIAQSYINKFGGSKPREESIRRALATGKLTRGRTEIDISDLIIDAKREQGRQILADVTTHVFDMQKTVKAEDVEAILFSGRSFGEGDYGYSSADVIKEKFDSLGTGCEFIGPGVGYLIPTGNAILVFSDFGGFLTENTYPIPRLPVVME